MTRIRITTVAALAILGLSRFDASAQTGTPRAVIDGIVADTNLAPIADVEASIAGSPVRIVTGANGRFRIIDLAPGEYTLGLRRAGYIAASMTLQLAAGDTARLSLTLVQGAKTADTTAASLQAAVRQTIFETHRVRGRGQFITEAEIARQHATSTRELLRGLSWVRIQGTTATSALATTFRDACPFQLFVDGAPLKSTNLDGLPAPADLLGIEVYAVRDAVPAEFQSFGRDYCGAVVAWSRSGS